MGKGQTRLRPVEQSQAHGSLGHGTVTAGSCSPAPLFPQSISGSDWLNTVAAGDITGELVAAVLPDLAVNPLNVKRSSDRRFVRGWAGLGGGCANGKVLLCVPIRALQWDFGA